MVEQSDLLRKIKGLFVVEESVPTTTNETTKNNAVPVTPTVSNPSYTPPPTVMTVDGSYNQKVFDNLTQALEGNNMQGFDYLEFRGSLLSLSKMPMDEATRYQSAYAMAQTMGATAGKLVETAGHYLNVLKNEELKFNQALENQQKSGLASREQEISGLQNAIQQKSELLKQITQEIQQHQTKIEEIKQQINDSTTKIAQANNDFHVTYDGLVGQIQQDVQNIQKYLK